MGAFPRGSEWRKWDLQVHTPYSALNNGFGADFDRYAKAVLEQAATEQIAVIGVTDYFSIRGYRELRLLVSDDQRLGALVGLEVAAHARSLLLLPNVELRTSVIVRRRDGSDSRVNFHVVFSDLVDPQTIEEDFLQSLRFTAAAGPSVPDESWALTWANLEALGVRLKAQHPPFRSLSDVAAGMQNAVIRHEDVTEVLERQSSRFLDRYLLIVPPDEDLSEAGWDGQGHLARKLLLQKSHAFFSGNAGTREFGLGRRHPSRKEFIDEFASLKPCVTGSDAHSFGQLFRQPEGRQTWIKADPTFNGLRQILAEPEGRVFIGSVPPGLERVRARPTKVVRSVEIRKVPGATISDTWFDSHLDLNSDLVAVIGNKGSGKSALADVLGLLGNTPRSDAFSFLSATRFRQPRTGKAQHFEATLEWLDGTRIGPRRLSDNPDPAAVETIKYIPQNYLEEICNEVGAGRAGRFYAELEHVIFSHVPETDRLGHETLEELLDSLGRNTQRLIDQKRTELRQVNEDLAEIEEQLRPEHRRHVEQQVEEKRREVAAHAATKPPTPVAPDDDPAIRDASAQALAELGGVRQQEALLADEIAALLRQDAAAAQSQAIAGSLVERLQNLASLVQVELDSAATDFAAVGVLPAEVVSFSLNLSPVRAVETTLRELRAAIGQSLDPEKTDGLHQRKAQLAAAITDLESRLSAPQQAYRRELDRVSTWEEEAARLVGSPDVPGSLSHLEARLEDLAELPHRAGGLRRRRRRLVLEIHREQLRLRSHFERYYRPVQEFLQTHPVAADGHFRLTFSASIVQADLNEPLLAMINQRRVGPFSGVDEGRDELERRLGAVDWGSGRGVVRFAEGIVESMRRDEGRDLEISDQLRQGFSVADLYDRIFGLEYLRPQYELRWDGRLVDELSPGERGNLLLVFYLLIDRDNIPLVIDQPEENLDNQTIVETLVPCMRDAKKRRQVIMVTHNPNLAVVCDADQIVHARLEKDASNRVSYRSGSIEDSTSNRSAVDILEGTRPAFDQRDARYLR